MAPGHTETLDLLERWRAGDRAALDALLRRDLAWIQRRVHHQLGDGLRRAGDTGDFVQEVALEVLRDGPQFVLASRSQFRALLAKIISNVLRAGHRRLHAHKRDAGREQPLPATSVLRLDGHRGAPQRPDEAAALAEMKEWLRLGVLLLEPDDRTVVELHWQGLSDAEIGARVGAVANTARMRRTRAIGRLVRLVRQLKTGQLAAVLDGDRGAGA